MSKLNIISMMVLLRGCAAVHRRTRLFFWPSGVKNAVFSGGVPGLRL